MAGVFDLAFDDVGEVCPGCGASTPDDAAKLQHWFDIKLGSVRGERAQRRYVLSPHRAGQPPTPPAPAPTATPAPTTAPMQDNVLRGSFPVHQPPVVAAPGRDRPLIPRWAVIALLGLNAAVATGIILAILFAGLGVMVGLALLAFPGPLHPWIEIGAWCWNHASITLPIWCCTVAMFAIPDTRRRAWAAIKRAVLTVGLTVLAAFAVGVVVWIGWLMLGGGR